MICAIPVSSDSTRCGLCPEFQNMSRLKMWCTLASFLLAVCHASCLNGQNSSVKESVLYSIDDPHRLGLVSTLTGAKDGNYYGLTSVLGPDEFGTFFQLTPAGSFTNVYDFCGDNSGCISGEDSANALIQ